MGLRAFLRYMPRRFMRLIWTPGWWSAPSFPEAIDVPGNAPARPRVVALRAPGLEVRRGKGLSTTQHRAHKRRAFVQEARRG